MLRKVLALQHSTHTLVSQALDIVDEDSPRDRGKSGRRERIDLNNLGDNVWLEQFRYDVSYVP